MTGWSLPSWVVTRRARSRRLLRAESLESRTLLAGDPVITELMASNRSSLTDGDRQSSDWIEIYNRGDEPISLEGWHLTDDATQLTKWSFPPDVTLGVDQYLVVFASGKNTVDRRGFLHTSFRISAGGEYLALVRPDGITVQQEFAPAFPAQLTDVAYGLRMEEVEVKYVAAGSPAQVLIPQDASLGVAWTSPSFVPDGRWLTEVRPGAPLTVGVGFENDSGFGDNIRSDLSAAMRGVNATAYVRIPFVVDDVSEVKELLLRMKYDDGYVVYLNGHVVDVKNASFFSTFNSTATAQRPNQEVLTFEELEISELKDRLVTGRNVLAIHGLNISAADDDFLILPELLTTGMRIDTGAAGYFSTPTPGARNPDQFSLGPRILSVQHTPDQPASGDTVTVTAHVEPALHPVNTVTLTYRVMYDAEQSVAMTDDGAGVDRVAGDGVYSARIPADVAQPGQMLRYYVLATDTAGTEMRAPRIVDTAGTDRSPEYLGTVMVDPGLTSQLPIFQWFTESTSRARSRGGARASVYYAGEFYDNIFVRQRGGATNASSQKFNFGDDQPFFVNEKLGRVREINLNAQGSDPAFLRQPLAFQAYTDVGNQSSESFLLLMRVNGRPDRVGIFIEQVDEDFLERYGLDPEGALYKFVQRSNLDPVFRDTTTGIEKKTRLDEDNSDLRALVAGLNRATRDEQARAVFDHFNVAQLMTFLAVRSVTMDADDVRKNFYLYRDTNGTGQWWIFPWDKDWTFGVTGDGGPDLPHPFFGDRAHWKPNANQWNVLYDIVFNHPTLREMYLRRLRSVMDQLLQPPDTPTDQLRYEQRVDQMFSEAQADLPRSAAGNVTSLKRFFPDRRDTLYIDHSIDRLGVGPIIDLVPEFVSGVQYFVPTNDELASTWYGLVDPANIAAWSVGQTGLGFGSTTTFGDLIKTTVRPADACADCTSIYVRIPFEVSDPAQVQRLTLRMKYDDGFVAYLNGVEVARANYDGQPAYNGRARSRTNSAAVQFQNFDISEQRGLLRPGRNILAVHSFNASPTNNDQLIVPVLIDGVVGDENAAGIPHAQPADPLIRFGTFEHNPASGNQDEEYIQLVNPNDTAIDISDWSLTGGIEHAFPPGTVIPKGGSLYVTPSVQAFLTRRDGPHGDQGLFVQGNYRGHLSNFGETVTLISADGTVIDSFTTPLEPSDAQRYLRISEVHYNPPGLGDATEFIELTNIGIGAQSVTLDLSGVSISDGPAEPFMFPQGVRLASGEYLLVVKDRAAFRRAYPVVPDAQIAGVFMGSLNNVGEHIKLDDARGSTILEFTYGDGALWPQSADGVGASLELVDPRMTPTDELGKPSRWRGSAEFGGSPGRAGANPVGVVINEVRSNTDAPDARSDAIELFNPTSQSIDIGGWYLSDSATDLVKYAIPAGTRLAPGQYVVFDERQFNPPGGDKSFALDGTEGDDVWLVIPDGQGGVAGFVDDVHFGAARPDETFGRLPNGHGRLVPLARASLGAENTAPRAATVIISEIQYHPPLPSASARAIDRNVTSDDLEFIEVSNTMQQTIDLSGWRLRGGVDFEFPSGSVLPAGGALVVISFDPTNRGNEGRRDAFRAHYHLDERVVLVGGYTGQLSDSSERIVLLEPGDPDPGPPPIVPFWQEDEVVYDDRTPWPEPTDGTGWSLQRRAAASLGNDPANWLAAIPTPGSVGRTGDFNSDAQINASDVDLLCTAARDGDPMFDLTGDARTDLSDLQAMIEDVLRTTFGDANLDGVFDSGDLVAIFQAGEYEDSIAGNSTWATGDWNCDGEFDTGDLVVAFREGGYRR